MTAVDRINGMARRVPTWPLYILGLFPVPWLLYLAQTGGLGREPIKALEHELGLLALQLLIAGLTITPLRRHLGLNLIKFRRMIGVLAFIYVALHLLVWVVLDMSLLWSEILKDLVKRWYIIIGMAAFVLMVPLALTSNDWALRKVGPVRWRQMHKAAYAIALLGGLHFVLLVKGFQIEPLVYLGITIALLALRLPAAQKLRFA